MSTFELDTIMTIASSINQVFCEFSDDPRLMAIQGRSCVYRAALTRALLTRQGITNTFWTGDVRWASKSESGNTPSSKVRYLDCFERDAAQGDLGGHVCNLVQLNDGTCWLVDITMDQFQRSAERREDLWLPAIKPPSILMALTPNKRLETIKKSGWALRKTFSSTSTWCEYNYDTLIGFRRVRKLHKQGKDTGLNALRWPDIYQEILSRFDSRMATLATLPSASELANYHELKVTPQKAGSEKR